VIILLTHLICVIVILYSLGFMNGNTCDMEQDEFSIENMENRPDKRTRNEGDYSRICQSQIAAYNSTINSLNEQISKIRYEFFFITYYIIQFNIILNRTEYEIMKNSKDAHIEQLLQERQSLMECNQNLNSINIKINDENKILKKAVNIQENRLKDLNNQNSTLQGIVSQAADYVVTLENTIVQLRQQLDRNTDISSNYIIPPRPPDVY
jgi:hypothetical protein